MSSFKVVEEDETHNELRPSSFEERLAAQTAHLKNDNEIESGGD
jgi:hypothetical protein